MIRVTVWNEFFHEQENDEIKAVYPEGIHNAIASFLKSDEIQVKTATLYDPECGLTQEVLDNTDVLIWWGHCKHDQVPDEVADRVQQAVLKGMGMIFLHSAHKSKPFMRLIGSTGNLIWREEGERERVWVVNPSHPITQGLGAYFEIPHEEMYGEHFDIPTPDELVFIGWFQGGEVFRSGCCFHRGRGNIFYFQPGHESYPNYRQAEIQQVIKNAVHWANPTVRVEELKCRNVKSIEPLS